MIKLQQYDLKKNMNSQVEEWQNDIKNSIKSFYLQKKKDDELIDKYEKTFQTLKNEYTIIYKRNEDLEKENKELKEQMKQMQTKENQFYQNQFDEFHQNRFRKKRPLSRYDYEEENDENIQYIIKKKRNNPPRIIYEEESEKEENNEMNVDQKKDDDVKIIKRKNKGISKLIKM